MNAKSGNEADLEELSSKEGESDHHNLAEQLYEDEGSPVEFGYNQRSVHGAYTQEQYALGRRHPYAPPSALRGRAIAQLSGGEGQPPPAHMKSEPLQTNYI